MDLIRHILGKNKQVIGRSIFVLKQIYWNLRPRRNCHRPIDRSFGIFGSPEIGPDPPSSGTSGARRERNQPDQSAGLPSRRRREKAWKDQMRDRLKLCDFGSVEWFIGADGERLPMCGVVGMPYYVAPEVLAGREYNEKVDVWSAGVILYIMLGSVPPFFGESVEETFHAVIRANLRFPARNFRSVSSEAKDLIQKMLCKDVSRRLSAEQVLRHPWVVDGGNTA